MKFEIVDFTNVCKFISCRSFEEFAKMYSTIGFIGISYAKEKYETARYNFINWWCNLDIESQEKLLAYVKDFYKA